MSQAAIRTAIYDAVSGVSDVGQVYDYERHANEWNAFLDLFQSTITGNEQILGWAVSYRGIITSERDTFRPGSKSGLFRTHRFQILGIAGIDDANGSEKVFAALAEAVCDALDDDNTLQSYISVSPASMRFDPAPFSGVLVHGALIIIDVKEGV